MNTKKAIDEKINLLLNLEALYKHSGKPNYARIMSDCIKEIKRGEKLEQIFNKLENCLLPEQYKTVKIIKQKYFPKGVNKL